MKIITLYTLNSNSKINESRALREEDDYEHTDNSGFTEDFTALKDCVPNVLALVLFRTCSEVRLAPGAQDGIEFGFICA